MQAQGSPLVQGTAPGAQAQQRVRVLRAFWLHSQRQEVGTVVTVPRGLAQELLYQRRAERVPDEPAAPVAPPTATPTPSAAKTTARAPRRAQE